jgi:transposase InsO family protein
VIIEIYQRSRRSYGWRRIRAELADAYGQQVNKKLIQSIMVELSIAGLPTRRRGKANLINRETTTDLVNRDFARARPNRLWMTDIERHEAFLNPAVVKGHRCRFVAASRLKLRAA